MNRPIPQIVSVNGFHRLLVDGRPFLVLGLQWIGGNCYSPEEVNPLFPHVAQMGANTAVVPIYWRQVEPVREQFDFAVIDDRIEQARTNGLRLIPEWFGAWRVADHYYAPDYVQQAPETYQVALDPMREPTISLCPLSRATWEAERAALLALMDHLRTVDSERTVIMLQLENEPGILGSDRCYCETCNAQFEAGPWREKYGAHAAEAFSVVGIHSYIDRLAAEVKAIYPLPLFTNVWLAPGAGGAPGSYPSGGAVAHMLELARRHTPHLDLIAPDIYRHSYRDYQRLCETYVKHGNPLFVVETSTGPTARAERNVFYTLGEHGGLGFDPWAVDATAPDFGEQPLVDPVSGQWAPYAYWLQDSYVAIGRAMQPIVEAQGTERLFTCVQEAGERAAQWAAQGCDVVATYTNREGAGRGFIIQEASDRFLLVGVGFAASFFRPCPDCSPIPYRSLEWGRYEGAKWVTVRPQHLRAGRVVTLREPGVVRVVLDVER